MTAPGEAQKRAAIWHVRKEDVHQGSARDVDPPFASFDVVLYRHYAALVERVEAAERERDGWRRHAQTSDKEVAALRQAAGDPDYSPAYQNEYQRLWHEQSTARVAAEARVAELEEALRQLRSAWNAHFDRCQTPLLDGVSDQAFFAKINEWMNAPSDTASGLVGVPVAEEET